MPSHPSSARRSLASTASGDTGYVFGGVIAGTVADALGYGGAIACVAALTAVSGLWVLFDMPGQDRTSASTRSRKARSAALPAKSRARP
jgi:predicted MFS family arabinose efflux permease